jgi:DNA polymerase III delta subunit
LKPNDKKQHFPYQKPYYAYNLSKASQKFKRKKLVDFFDNLTDFDIKMKSGSKFERILLEHGLLET